VLLINLGCGFVIPSKWNNTELFISHCGTQGFGMASIKCSRAFISSRYQLGETVNLVLDANSGLSLPAKIMTIVGSHRKSKDPIMQVQWYDAACHPFYCGNTLSIVVMTLQVCFVGFSVGFIAFPLVLLSLLLLLL
jgi:hypothetical protein